MTDILERASSGHSPSAVSWAAIIAGAVVALATTLICLALGSGFGAASVSPWPQAGLGVKTFTAAMGIWLIATQWVASGVGGYITGRLRTRWHGTHTHEVFFRDTANGFITWALATVIVAALGAVLATTAANTAMQGATPAHVSAESLDAARKAAASFSIISAVSMLVGAFVSCVAAALGGQQRDEHP